eukprot:TRINITY_DN12302_c0_g1_i2.p1 TRINITY_DN12302_c0_g1~~TRINITY_DN12302_c0_g1_i2.p1  ORF type:complete len:723 (+),score=154.56 TRINITY_DN12302_c0_g1_i2:52-2169(+)
MLSCVDAFRHAAARVIAQQQDLVAEVANILRNPECMPPESVVVIKAACLLTRSEVPHPDVTAVIVAKQFLESPVLLKRLAELEDVLLPFSTLSKLEGLVSEDEFSSPLLPPPVASLAECVFALYDYHCAAISDTKEQSLGGAKVPSISPLRRESSSGGRDEPAADEYSSAPGVTEESNAPSRRSGRASLGRRSLGDHDETQTSRDKVLLRCSTAARTVKRVALSDFQRLASFFTCPAHFQPYCLALGGLLSVSAPEAFQGRRLSLGSAWSALRLLAAKPAHLSQLLTDCDAWETSPQAAVSLSKVGEVPLPVSQLNQASPAALALANWTVCFYDKWTELGRPVRSTPVPPTPASVQKASVRSSSAHRRSRSWVRSNGNTDARPAARHRSRSSHADRAEQAEARRSRSSAARSLGRKGSGRVPRKPAAADIDVLEDQLLKRLADIRTLTPRDLSVLASHRTTASESSRMTQACVEGLAAITGLGGDCPADGTVDLWSVGITALQNQPHEVLTAVRSLESTVLSESVLHHVDSLLPRMSSNQKAPPPYHAVGVLRAWMQSTVRYQRQLKSGPGLTPDLGPVEPVTATEVREVPAPLERFDEKPPVHPSVPTPCQQDKRQLEPIQCETLSPIPPRSIRPPACDEEVSKWLEEAGLVRYISTFAQHEVDIATLLLLEESDLQAMQIPVGPKRKIMALIEEQKGQGSPGY